MRERHMPADQVEPFLSAARAASEAFRAIDGAILALLPFADEGTPAAQVVAELQKHADNLRGLGYMLTPQSEWMGGDSMDPRNFKVRWPHFVNDQK